MISALCHSQSLSRNRTYTLKPHKAGRLRQVRCGKVSMYLLMLVIEPGKGKRLICARSVGEVGQRAVGEY